jgi:hypothetical protein
MARQKITINLNTTAAVNIKAGDEVLLGVDEAMEPTEAHVIVEHLKTVYPGVGFTFLSGVKSMAIATDAELKEALRQNRLELERRVRPEDATEDRTR